MSRFVTPDYLEKFHVRDVYDKIAPYFAGSRHKAWPKVEAFLRSLPPGSIVVDVGCGTGKYLSVTLDSLIIGSDSCMTFAEIANTKGHSVVTCDNQSLPFKDGCCDAVISIGVVHHFASAKRRIKALQELFRILRPGGKMLVYVWALEQNQRKFDGQDVLVPYTHHPRNRGTTVDLWSKQTESSGRKRSQPIPKIPRRKSMIDDRGSSPLGSTPPRRSRRAFSCDESLTTPEKPGKERLTIHSGNELFREHSGKDLLAKDSVSSSSAVQLRQTGEKCGVQQQVKSGEGDSSSEQERNTEQATVSRLRQFFANVLEKFFPSEESSTRWREETRTDSVSGDGVTDLHAKVSTLASYLSENRDKYLSLLAKRFLSNKEELSLSDAAQGAPNFSETSQESPSSGKVTSAWERNSHQHGDVVVFKAEETKSDMNGIGLSVGARLVESLASSSDIDSDSSSSSDFVSSDSSAVDDWDPIGVALVAHSNRTFRHTTVDCREDFGAQQATSSEESLSSSSTSLWSSSSSSSLSSSSATSSSGSLSHNKVKSKLFQRYYHVFCAGEMAQLVRDGIPSASVLHEYYDHGNWAVVVMKGQR